MEIENADSFLNEDIWKDSFVKVRRLCEYKLRSHPNEVEDVMSEIYLALMKAVRNNNIPENPKAWLYSVANNIIKSKYADFKKTKKRIVSISDTEMNFAELSVYPDYSDIIITQDDIDHMSDGIMALLSSEEQKLLIYYHHENKTLKEIAKIFGKSESAVKQKHYRLCIKIKKLIKDQFKNY